CSPGVPDPISAVIRQGRVPLDKEKGVVKGKDILSGAEHRFPSTSERVGPGLWDITALSFFWWIAPPSHRYDRNYDHDFLCGHPAAESVRKWETPEVFSKALAPSSA
ncbi:MAG: hypothetical protein WB421_17795, partial [Terriglobales bacterium]